MKGSFVMKHGNVAGLVLLACTGLFGCGDSSQPSGPAATVKIFVDSDPRGGTITLDGTATTQTTPDTLRAVTNADHDVGAQVTKNGLIYGSAVHVTKGAIPASVILPLIARCGSVSCVSSATSFTNSGAMKFGVNALGPLFTNNPTAGGGLLWPSTSHNNYASFGAPVFASIPTGSSTPVGLGVYTYTADYPVPYWAGRTIAPPLIDPLAIAHPASWIVAPPAWQALNTIRGLEIVQEVSASPLVSDALIIRVVFRNITNLASYRAVDPAVPSAGIIYDQAYLGFALDPDIGDPTDDYVTYAPNQNMVFAYDSDFRENAFEVDSDRPGLLGLQLLSAPAGTKVVLNSWPIAVGNVLLDWQPGNANESFGYNVLARTTTPLLQYTSSDTRIGNVGTTFGDYRMSVSAGPVRLAPGDSAVIKVAVMIAPPVQGTFVSTRDMPPGDPTDPNRPIMKTAATLLQKAQAIAAGVF
jgi:hypothetical protein